MVDRCDLVVKDIGIVPVGKNPLLDDGLAVGMERNAAAVVGVRDLDEAGLDRKRVVASVGIGVLPLADRVARVGGLHGLRPFASIGEDAAQRAEQFEHDVGGGRRDHDLHRLHRDHDARHRSRNTAIGWVGALPARSLVL